MGNPDAEIKKRKKNSILHEEQQPMTNQTKFQLEKTLKVSIEQYLTFKANKMRL
jgi:hypothetical protein